MITSLRNPKIVQMRKLHRSKEREKQNLILLEGTNLIEAALQVNYPLVTVFHTSFWRDRHPQLFANLVSKSANIELVSSEVVSSIATTVNPDGIVATAAQRKNPQIFLNKVNLGAIALRLQDPGNLGTIIRTAVAADADGIWLSRDTVDLANPKVLRASTGAWFKLPMVVTATLTDIVTDFRQRGGQIIATTPRSDLSYWEVDFNIPSLILLGNESSGLSEDLLNLADIKVNIPLANGVESLNVGIAAALLFYEARRQKRMNI